MTPAVRRGCEALVFTCADVRPGERVLVVTDPSTRPLGEALRETLLGAGADVDHRTVDAADRHGAEPPETVARAMRESDVVFGLTSMSMAHTRSRRAACEAGTRYVSLPDYSPAVLASPALGADFRALAPTARRLAAILDAGNELRITTAAGTDLACRIDGRRANAAPGFCDTPGSLASPPDAEVNVPPAEAGCEGDIVVDGGVPHPDLRGLPGPLHLTVRAGRVVDAEGPSASAWRSVVDAGGDPAWRTVAEIGLGLNPLARLGRSMLEDEGVLGTAHVGLGSNATIGGDNDVPFHLDHILRDVTVAVDGRTILDSGRFRMEEGG